MQSASALHIDGHIALTPSHRNAPHALDGGVSAGATVQVPAMPPRLQKSHGPPHAELQQ